MFLIAFLAVACASGGGMLALSWYVRREDVPAPKREPRVVVEAMPRAHEPRGD